MTKALYIAEKPSVAQEFARALKMSGKRGDGYLESEDCVITWCVGHLVTMSYPEAYDIKYKKWSLSTLPFLPDTFKYEVIPSASRQFAVVKGLLNRPDIGVIYVCTDSGREGEYIYRLVEQMAGVKGKERRRVWIDSQTEEEILRGIREAKDLSEYDNLAASAYLRAKEDYLMGINFSRLLTLKYGNTISSYLHTNYTVLSVGRVMTCVLGMVVRREREIRNFVKTPFYRVISVLSARTDGEEAAQKLEAEFRAVEGSRYYGSPLLYKENGFQRREDAGKLIESLAGKDASVREISRRQEKKNPPLLYNLAELQNECSRMMKISPDETLKIVQELYEKKLVTYPRTDARVLSTAVAKEISKNLSGLRRLDGLGAFAGEILESGSYKGIARTRYTNDKQITDHYAIIPTGQGMGAYASLSDRARRVYTAVVRRFLSIFYPAAVYQKISMTADIGGEAFMSSYRILLSEGYLKVAGTGRQGKNSKEDGEDVDIGSNDGLQKLLAGLRKGSRLHVEELQIREGETSPPKRYNSGSMILAMENAGQLIEDEELRAQIKGSGIGTSATRAEILKKLVNIKYLALNKKTQILTPTQLGEMVFDVVNASIRSLLNPDLTASWEKGLTYVAEGQITEEEYMKKLDQFIISRTEGVLKLNNQYQLKSCYDAVAVCYQSAPKKGKKDDEDRKQTAQQV